MLKKKVSGTMSKLLLVSMLMLITLSISYASPYWILVPNGSFESGTLGSIPDNWVMKTYDYTEYPPPISTYIHEVCEIDTHFFNESRSCWLHSRVVDTDGTARSRGSWTWIEPENWICQPSATHVRFYARDIQSTHSLSWGWNNYMFLKFNDSVTEAVYWDIYQDGETIKFHYYNDTKVGADGATWYEYICPIPEAINKSHMKVQIICISGDWTFYDTSYFSDLEFVVDKVELLVNPTHDIGITNVIPYKTVAGQNYTALIMVNCSNYGDFEETFNLTAYRNGTPIIIEQWSNNTYSDTFWSMGDVNRDGHIDAFDAYLIAEAFGWVGPPGKNPADINSDGEVDLLDAAKCGVNLGRNIWTYFEIEKVIQDYAVVTLGIGDYKIIGFRWNTTGFAYGNYAISAYAWPVENETNTEDNTLINGNVFVTIPGDINGDTYVNAKDGVLLGVAFYPDGVYNPNADINGDGYCNAKDAIIIGTNWTLL